jgi:hypothetical protein
MDGVVGTETVSVWGWDEVGVPWDVEMVVVSVGISDGVGVGDDV